MSEGDSERSNISITNGVIMQRVQMTVQKEIALQWTENIGYNIRALNYVFFQTEVSVLGSFQTCRSFAWFRNRSSNSYNVAISSWFGLLSQGSISKQTEICFYKSPVLSLVRVHLTNLSISSPGLPILRSEFQTFMHVLLTKFLLAYARHCSTVTLAKHLVNFRAFCSSDQI